MPLVRAQISLPEKTSFYLNPANPGPPVVSPDEAATAAPRSGSDPAVPRSTEKDRS